MGRVIKTNLGKYSNPNLAQGSKVAVLASIVEYLNGEEFVRIVTAPLKYTSPAFVASTEEELRAEIKFVPTPMASRCDKSVYYGGSNDASRTVAVERGDRRNECGEGKNTVCRRMVCCERRSACAFDLVTCEDQRRGRLLGRVAC